MYEPNSKVIMIWIRSDLTAARTVEDVASWADQPTRVLEHARELAQRGADVEVWTRRCGDGPQAVRLAGGERVLRFPCGDCGSVREPTPCEYVGEFVGRVTERLEELAPSMPTLVGHFWDAGVAARTLAVRFGLPFVFVPHVLGLEEQGGLPADGPAARELSRRVREERETCRGASRVVALTPRQRELLLGEPYAVPQGRLAFSRVGERTYKLGDRPLGVESRLTSASARFEDCVL
jgi:hypothetical protein